MDSERRQTQAAGDGAPSVCERCGSSDDVHGGLCRHCQETLRRAERSAEEARPPHRQEPEVEPLHNPPWRRRGA